MASFHREKMGAAAVCSRHLSRGRGRTIEADVEFLFDPLARGHRDLERDLCRFADLELEPGGYGASHGC